MRAPLNYLDLQRKSLHKGLDKLGKRLLEYKELGATFTKWRAVYSVDKNMPSEAVITGNSIALAQYASLVQEAGLVPIVEPEILVLSGSHTIQKVKKSQKSSYRCFSLVKRT